MQATLRCPTRSRRAGATLALAFLVGLAGPFPSASAAPCGQFGEEPLPDPSVATPAVAHLAALSDGTAWGIGTRAATGTTPWLLFFDGSDWSAQPLPAEAAGMAFSASGSTPDGDVWLTGTRPYTVYEVEVILLRARGGVIDRIDHVFHPKAPVALSATSSSDVWALTSESDVLHFDGTGWTETDVPELFLLHNYAQGIHAVAPDDVWSIGYGGDSRGEYIGYVLHWDGTSWSEVPTPFAGQGQTYFRGIDGSAPDDLWIVGNTAVGQFQSVALHWNGSAWNEMSPPASNAPLQSVAALAADDVWATPYSLTDYDVLYHWDGSAWSEILPLAPPAGAPVRWGGNLAKAGACDLWASGSYFMDPAYEMVLARLEPGAAVDVPSLPLAGATEDAWIRAEPNPFRSETMVRLALPREAHVRLVIHDVTGRRVATLMDDRLSAGDHTVAWNGRDAQGSRVAPGAYFVRIEAGPGSDPAKVVLIR